MKNFYHYHLEVTKAAKINCYPVENSSIANMSIYEDKIAMLGFENVIPTNDGKKDGITTNVTKIAKDDIGLKSNFIKAADFMHYVLTGKSAITSDGLKILKDQIEDEEALGPINELVADKSSEELKEYDPFSHDFLSHEPEVECAKDHFTIDDLTLSWEEGISISFGEVEVSVDLEESSVSVKEGDNEISFGSDGVTLRGEYEGKKRTYINYVKIGEDGLSMAGEEAYVNINENGLFTGSSTEGHPDVSVSVNYRGTLKITSEGLEFDGPDDAKLTLGENFEYLPLDLFKPK